MARIREYTQQTQAPMAEVGGRRATSEDVGSAFGSDLAEAGRSVQNTAQFLYKYEVDKEVSDAQANMAKADAQFEARQRQLQAEAQPGVPTAAQIRDEMDEYFTTMRGNYTTPEARRYVELHGTRLKTGAMAKSSAFDIDLIARDRNAKISELERTNVAMTFDDPRSLEARVKALEFDVENKLGVWSSSGDARVDIAMREQAAKIINSMAVASSQASLSNPAARGNAVAKVQNTVPDSSAKIIAGVVGREGAKIVPEDGGQGASKFGITQKNHPGVNVAALTKEEAASIYQQKWNEYRIDMLPPETRAIVFDGMVNHWKGFRDNLYQAAANGASVDQLAQMRVAEYQRLAAKPEYAKNLKGWLNRVAEVSQESYAAAPVVTQEVAEKLTPEMPDFYKYLNPSQKMQWLNQAQAKQKQEMAIAHRANDAMMKDQMEFWTTTGKLPVNRIPPANLVDPIQREEYQAFIDIAGKTQAIIGMQKADQDRELEKMRPVLGPDTPGMYSTKVKMFEQAVRMVSDANKKRAEDPMGIAQARGYVSDVTPITPEEFNNPQKFGERLTIRFPQAQAVQTQDGIAWTPVLSNQESRQFAAQFEAMNVKERSDWLTGAYGSMTDERYVAVTRQIFKDNTPALVAADAARVNRPDVVRDIMTGQLIMSGASEDKALRKAALPSPEQINRVMADIANGVGIDRNGFEAMAQGAMAHYIGVMAKAGKQDMTLGKSDTSNIQEFKNTVKKLYGEPVSIGSTKVFPPMGMDGSTFKDRVEYQAQMRGAPAGYSLEMLPGYKYGVVAGGNPTGIVIDPKAMFGDYSNEGYGQRAPIISIRSNPAFASSPADEYIRRGFFGNLGSALLGGTLAEGGAGQ